MSNSSEVKLKQNVGLAHDPQLGVAAHRVLHLRGGLEDRLGVLAVALAAELTIDAHVAASSPPEREPSMPGRAVLAAGPVGEEEVLGVAPRLVAEQQHRRALEGVAVLVGVGRDAGDAGEAEVEHRDVVAELLAERQDEAAEAAVDVQPDARSRRRGRTAPRSGRPCRSRSCRPSR
jgi:hypothetical protein